MINLDNSVIICDNENKIKLLKNNNEITNVKFFNLDEFINEIYFTVNKNYLIYLYKKYSYNIELLSSMPMYFYYIDEFTDIKNEKIQLLKNIKDELINNDYIMYNEHIIKYLEKKNIIFYNLENSSNLNLAIKKLNENNIKYNIVNDDIYNNILDITCYPTINEEIMSTVIRVQELLNSGVDINNIKIHTLSSNYPNMLKEYLDIFNIPNNILNKTMISSFDIVVKFLELLKINTIEETLLIISENLSGVSINVYNKLISILNNYDFTGNYDIDAPIIKYLCSHTSVDYEYLENFVCETSIKSINKDDYIFVLGFNNKEIVNIKKDTDYLSDFEKQLIGMDTSVDINNQRKEDIIKSIAKCNNAIVSYKLKTSIEECVLFDGVENLKKLTNVSINNFSKIKYINTELNKIIYKGYIDDYRKFKIYNEDIKKLENNLDISLFNFDNSFSNLNDKNIELLNEKQLNLSYTKIEKYNKCAFSYFLDYILYLKDNDTKKMDIGNVFHKCLYYVIKTEKENFSELVDDFFIEYNEDKELSKKELLFNEIYKKEILTVLEHIDKYNKRSNFETVYLEKEIELTNFFDKNINIKGIIDKVMYFDDNDINHTMIIDYKTGNVDVNQDLIEYGINVQTLFYAFLLKESKIVEDLNIVGLYKQKVLVNKQRNNANLLYKNLLKDEYKLSGITLNNLDIINKIDYDYSSDCFVKGIKVKKDGDLSKNRNLLTDNEIDENISKVVKNIEKVSNLILNGVFDINPKMNGNADISCSYCTHKDICFKTKKDYISIVKEEKEEGDIDA